MTAFETLLNIGYTILSSFSEIIEFFSTKGITIGREWYSLSSIIFGAGIPIIISAIIAKWIIDFIT